jgi:hypothetical protein
MDWIGFQAASSAAAGTTTVTFWLSGSLEIPPPAGVSGDRAS